MGVENPANIRRKEVKNMAKPSDQRSNVKNPNNPAHKSAVDNKANQKNPNHAASKGKK